MEIVVLLSLLGTINKKTIKIASLLPLPHKITYPLKQRMKLVIVESPAKCKKIASFLGPGFVVLATMGHIRALDEDLDAVGIERDFEPRFRFLSEKSKATKPILEAASKAEIIYLAADDDREGEAIAYSVACLLKKDPLSFPRSVFHEITEKAIKHAIQNPRKIDLNRVYAQQARAVLDMMVGFTISPLLWKHVARALSAGRCQTPALRLVWDREQAIKNHSSLTTWNLSGSFSFNSFKFPATMDDGLEDQESAMNYMENIHESNEAVVSSVQQKPWTLNPPKPLITSTLQQEASALFSINPKATMKIAQSLYEAGHITYMRTDHAILSEEAIEEAQAWVKEEYGETYVGPATVCRASTKEEKSPKKSKKKSSSDSKDENKDGKKDTSEKADKPEAQDLSSQVKKAGPAPAAQAQEAHEAIRPTHMNIKEIPGDWTPQEKKIYNLIWRRAVQATMSQAKGQTRNIEIKLSSDTDEFPWSSSFKTTEFEGWQILGKTAKLDDSEDDLKEDSSDWKKAQSLKEGTKLVWTQLQAAPKQSKANPRFTEATLIRELEQKGIGRPSTFASLVEVLFDKKYIDKQDISGEKVNQTTLLLKPATWPPETSMKQIALGAEKQKLVPTALGESVLTFCLKEFPHLFAYEFTAQMEGRLDSVSKGEEDWKNLCRDTWNSYKDSYARLKDKATKPTSSDKVVEFGNGFKAVMSKTGPLLVQENSDSPTSTNGTDSKGKKKKEDGPKPTFYSFPTGYTLSTITEEVGRDHIKALQEDSQLGQWDGKPILKKKGPYGLYAQCGDLRVPMTDGESLEKIYERLKDKSLTNSNNVNVGGYRFAKGPYGPYMFKEGLKTKNFVGIPSTVDPSTLTLAEAEELYKKCSELKKANTSSGGRGGRGGFRGGRGGFRGGRGSS